MKLYSGGKTTSINDDQWGIFHIYILYNIIWDYIRLYQRFPPKWEHPPPPWLVHFPPRKKGWPGSGMHTWTGATVAPRHEMSNTAWSREEWEILQEKPWKNHGKSMVKTRVSWRLFTWIKPFIATFVTRNAIGFVRVTKFENRHGKQWETYQSYNIGL